MSAAQETTDERVAAEVSVSCLHCIEDAPLHRSHCLGCASVSQATVEMARAAAGWTGLRQRELGLLSQHDRAMFAWKPNQFPYSRGDSVDALAYGLFSMRQYTRRHVGCGRIVRHFYEGVSLFSIWCCDCSPTRELTDSATYLGWPLPPRLPTAETVDELREQDRWNRVHHALVNDLLKRADYETPGGRLIYDERQWPHVVSWCLFVVSALVFGQEQEMGPYWEYMQLYCDAWTTTQTGGKI